LYCLLVAQVLVTGKRKCHLFPDWVTDQISGKMESLYSEYSPIEFPASWAELICSRKKIFFDLNIPLMFEYSRIIDSDTARNHKRRINATLSKISQGRLLDRQSGKITDLWNQFDERNSWEFGGICLVPKWNYDFISR
jgi:hypothetical protein